MNNKQNVFVLFLVLILTCGLMRDTIDTDKQEEPKPLVINQKVSEGTYKGVLLFPNEHKSYEGYIRIVFDGDRVHVICDNLEQSDYMEVF